MRATPVFHPCVRLVCTVISLVWCLVNAPSALAVVFTPQEQALANLLTGHPDQRRAFLKADPTLTRVARARAADMARRRYFGHVNPDGVAANYLVRAAGYALPASYGNDRKLNYIESIAAGRTSAADTWKDFMESGGHRQHLLAESDFYRNQTAFGVGHVSVPGSEYGEYWVIITAPPRPTPIVQINSPVENARFTTPQVTVSGTAGGGSIAVQSVQIRLENAAGTGEFSAVSGASNWTGVANGLAPGLNTIRVRSLDASGNVLAEAVRRVRYVVMKPLTVAVNGSGIVTPGFLGESQREVGATYVIAVRPSAGFLFAGWTGGSTSSQPRLAFTMIEGLQLTANFVPNAFISRRGVYSGVLTSATTPSPATAGVISINVTPKGSFTGKIRLGRAVYPISGWFNISGETTVTVRRRKATPLTVSLRLDVNGTNGVSASVSDGNFTSTAQALRTRQRASAPLANTGRYTIALPPNANEGSAGIPQGNGFAILAVNPAGKVQFLAKLADGTPVTQGGVVLEDGSFAIYAPLYSGSGFIAGQLRFSESEDSDVSGTLVWTKARRLRDRFYPNGFDTTLPIVGSKYSIPSPGTPAVRVNPGEGNSDLLLEEGNLTTPVEQPLTIQTNNRVSVAVSSIPGVSVVITPQNGIFRGTFVHPVSNKSHPIQGVIFQKKNAGFGFFLGIDQSGYTSLIPKE